ncbi:hypothetical protein [Myxococcus sp. RHSTA-1-4]|uniref:hypothetical protein n=1 Tax=Myxococcus sp. RHSTA-1-4 TaxID=2874601 RepID=UPI001CBD6C25|nr:hypothetical protein [Myxococcus sp. RHSTA-1-4]
MAANDIRCGHCGRLLAPELAGRESFVPERPLPPQRRPTLELPSIPVKQPTPHDLATTRFTVPLDAHTVPRLRARLDLEGRPLQPFEAHVASFIDGVQSVPDLARAARLPEIEVKVVLKGLLERGLVELHHTSTGELPVLDGNEFLVLEPMALGDEEPPPPPRRLTGHKR